MILQVYKFFKMIRFFSDPEMFLMGINLLNFYLMTRTSREVKTPPADFTCR